MIMQEELELKRLIGVRADPTYLTMRQMIMNNRMKTHEFSENKRIVEIKRNNQHLLDKLLLISKGKKSTTN